MCMYVHSTSKFIFVFQVTRPISPKSRKINVIDQRNDRHSAIAVRRGKVEKELSVIKVSVMSTITQLVYLAL